MGNYPSFFYFYLHTHHNINKVWTFPVLGAKCALFLEILVAEDELPVFTLISQVNQDKHLETIFNDASEEKESVIYLRIQEDEESENDETIPLVVQDDGLFGTSMVLDSGLKIVRVENEGEQFFYIPNDQGEGLC